MAPTHYDAHSAAEAEVALPSAPLQRVRDGIVVQRPLTRRGHGPGLIVIVPAAVEGATPASTLEPLPVRKWAEGECTSRLSWLILAEGWTVLGVEGCTADEIGGVFRTAIATLHSAQADEGPIGVVLYDETLLDAVIRLCAEVSEVAGLVVYGADPAAESASRVPVLAHLAPTHPADTGPPTLIDPTSNRPGIKRFTYPAVSSGRFALPGDASTYNEPAACVAHTRSLAFLKPLVGGPWFDLVAIWDEHVRARRWPAWLYRSDAIRVRGALGR